MTVITAAIRRGAALPALVTLLLAATSLSAQTIPLTFDPPDGTAYDLKEVSRTRTAMGDRDTQEEEMTSTTAIRIEKDSAGYRVRVQPTELVIRQNGVVVDNPTLAALRETVFTYRISPAGEMVDIRGYDAFIRAIEATYPAHISQQILSVYSESDMVAEEVAEWRRRFGNFIGRTVSVGDAWMYGEDFQLPNGTASRHFTVVEVAGWEGDHLRLVFTYHSDPAVLRDRFAGRLRGNPDDLPGGPGGIAVSGSGERLIDPATLLIYGERMAKRIETTVAWNRSTRHDGAGGLRHPPETDTPERIPLVIEEQSEMVFDYRE